MPFHILSRTFLNPSESFLYLSLSLSGPLMDTFLAILGNIFTMKSEAAGGWGGDDLDTVSGLLKAPVSRTKTAVAVILSLI